MNNPLLMKLIDDIYEAALDSEKWPMTLSSISSYIGSSFMSVIPYSDPSGIFMSEGGKDAMKGYTEYWFKYDTMVRVGIERRNFRGLLCDWEAIGVEQIARDRYYQEFRKDKRIGFCLGTTFEPSPGDYRALGLNMPIDRPPLDKPILDEIEGILRHTARALAITARSGPRVEVSRTIAETLNQMQCGAAIIDRLGHVILVNRALECMCGDGLDINQRRLKCIDKKSQYALDILVQDTTNKSAHLDRLDYALISRPSGRRPLMARAIAFSRDRLGIYTNTSGQTVLLQIVDLAEDLSLSTEKALKLLGLTNSEAKVANLVGSGLTPAVAAKKLGSMDGTVRNQLKQVFQKLQISRQSELVKLIHQISILGAK